MPRTRPATAPAPGPLRSSPPALDAAPTVATLTAQPSSTAPLSVTLSARLTNTGADPLPAGLPLTFSARGAAIRTFTTTEGLAPGAALELALDWSPGADGDWDVVVAPDAGERTLGDAVLCRIPDTAHFSVEPGGCSAVYRLEPRLAAGAARQPGDRGRAAAHPGHAMRPSSVTRAGCSGTIRSGRTTAT